MTAYLYPALFALGIWWLSTVVIIYLDGLKQWTFKYSMIGASVIFVVSLYGLKVTSHDASVSGAYLAFTYGLLAWGWQEMSFYMGFVTGTRKEPCPEGCKGLKHFGHAVQTSLYHELAIIVAAVAVCWLTLGGVNQIGMWTFMVLWWMHQSAKLNVFFGVRNLNEEFLPEHLEFLKGFLNKKSMNLLFPFSVTISTIITALLVVAAMADTATAFERAGYTFLGVLMALAILEHWMLVLPMPTAALWSPGLKSRGERQPFEAEVVVGFLGAGKTTTLRRMLAEADPNVKTVVLVNDFGELGIDGSLLDGQGADVVELSNGCICCSLRKDLSAQLRDVVAKMKPQRVLIEPSGVADVASLLGVLNAPEIKSLVKALRLYTVIDAGAFLNDYARMPQYFRMQAKLAPVFILNKTDLVTPGALEMIRETLVGLNPKATIVTARYGIVDGNLDPAVALSHWLDEQGPDAEDLDLAPAARSVTRTTAPAPITVQAPAVSARGTKPEHGSQGSPTAHDHAPLVHANANANGGGHEADRHTHGHDHDHDHIEHLHRADDHGHDNDHHDHADHDHGHHDHAANHDHSHAGHDHGDPGMGMSSWSRHLKGSLDADRLRTELARIGEGSVGQVDRMKGIARAADGWLRFDIAGGRASISAYAPKDGNESPRALAIGHDLDLEALDRIFAGLVIANDAGNAATPAEADTLPAPMPAPALAS